MARVTAVFPEPCTEKFAPLLSLNSAFKSLIWNSVNFILEKPKFFRFSISLLVKSILKFSEVSKFWLLIVSIILYLASSL